MTSRSLINRLTREIEGEFLSDNFSRGRYSTDASIYQLMPVGVVVPKSIDDVEATIKIAREEGLPVLPRGSGTSQNGQAIGEALLIDTTRHLNQVIDFNAEKNTVCVEPGLVLDQLNRFLKPHGLFYPVDVSTANRATLGGMTGNNSCGSRSLYYGNMVNNVLAVEAILDDGSIHTFEDIDKNLWSDFIKKHKRGNIFQTPEMFELYQQTPSISPNVVCAVENSKIIGILVSAIHSEFSGPFSYLSSRSIIVGGPVLCPKSSVNVLGHMLKNY